MIWFDFFQMLFMTKDSLFLGYRKLVVGHAVHVNRACVKERGELWRRPDKKTVWSIFVQLHTPTGQ
jgi:hypothetical protein